MDYKIFKFFKMYNHKLRFLKNNKNNFTKINLYYFFDYRFLLDQKINFNSISEIIFYNNTVFLKKFFKNNKPIRFLIPN